MRADEAALSEVRDLSSLVIQIADRTRADFAVAVAPFDLPVPVARVLLLLEEPTSMGEIAQYLACDPSYVTSITDQLEARCLVVRVPGKDRRVKLLQVTPEGQTLRRQVSEAVRTQLGFARRLDASERETLRALLERLLDT